MACGQRAEVDQVLRGHRVRKGRGFLAVDVGSGPTHPPALPAAASSAAAEASQNQRPRSRPTPAGRTGSLCCERLRQQRSEEISIPLAAGSGGVATPGYGAGSGEELVAEVVSDAGDVGAHDDGLVVVQVEAEEGGVSGGLAAVPGDGLATVVAGDLGPTLCHALVNTLVLSRR
jgi:hypothetical protein